MNENELQPLDAYEKTVDGRARELATSDNAAEAKVGTRMMACLACNRAALNQSCSTCTFGILAEPTAEQHYLTAEHFEIV